MATDPFTAIVSVHRNDDLGRPAGGVSTAIGVNVQWQDGPLRVDGVERPRNGAFVEEVIAIAADRLEYYQESQFCCIENAVALGHLRAALEILECRTQLRELRGVEGTHEK